MLVKFFLSFSQMVRNYVRKTERQKWDEMGFLKAANQYDVPKSSLERYVKKCRNNPDYKVDKSDGFIKMCLHWNKKKN